MAKPEKDNKMAIQNEGMALIHCQIHRALLVQINQRTVSL